MTTSWITLQFQYENPTFSILINERFIALFTIWCGDIIGGLDGGGGKKKLTRNESLFKNRPINSCTRTSFIYYWFVCNACNTVFGKNANAIGNLSGNNCTKCTATDCFNLLLWNCVKRSEHFWDNIIRLISVGDF